MIKRTYFLSGKIHKLNGSSFEIVYDLFTVKSFFADPTDALQGWIDYKKARMNDDDSLEITCFSRLPRWF